MQTRSEVAQRARLPLRRCTRCGSWKLRVDLDLDVGVVLPSRATAHSHLNSLCMDIPDDEPPWRPSALSSSVSASPHPTRRECRQSAADPPLSEMICLATHHRQCGRGRREERGRSRRRRSRSLTGDSGGTELLARSRRRASASRRAVRACLRGHAALPRHTGTVVLAPIRVHHWGKCAPARLW